MNGLRKLEKATSSLIACRLAASIRTGDPQGLQPRDTRTSRFRKLARKCERDVNELVKAGEDTNSSITAGVQDFS